MDEYDVGYRKPPKKTQFKPGTSGNPKGRPKRKPWVLADIIRGVLGTPIEYRERGRVKTVTRQELLLKMLVEQAIKGDLHAAEDVLKVRAHAQRFGDASDDILQVSDWLPDYPGQTAEQKTQEFVAGSDADPIAWWSKAGDNKATDGTAN